MEYENIGPRQITESMEERRRKDLSVIYTKINKSIDKASEAGRNSICFPVGKYDKYYTEVREAYQNAGYQIKPTGYIGGVWQLTEDLCW